MAKKDYEALKLEKQLCFPLYAASREVIKLYHNTLTDLNLTYTQYLVLMVMWENGQISEKELGKKLFLDSGTLTPVLKSLEKKGFIVRERSKTDERVVNVSLTEAGTKLKDDAVGIPKQITDSIPLSGEDYDALYALLYKLLDGIE